MLNCQVDRRRFERVQFFCEVQLTALPEGKVFPGRTLDISLGGVGLVMQAALKPGQMVAVSFLLRDKSGAEIGNRVLGRVVNLRADADANLIGVEFVEPLSQSGNPRLFSKVMHI
jgi:c-di-GMP-binding flagellar brake protein YcgR